MLNCKITNGRGPSREALVNEDGALFVVSKDYIEYKPAIRYFVNSLYGSDMNINVGVGGTPESVYAENIEWTTSAISGTWNFASTSIVHSGTKSIDATASGKNDSMQLKRSSSIDLSTYSVITGWIYFTSAGSSNKFVDIEGFDTSTGTIVGQSVHIDDYVNINTTGTWQSFYIPLGDMLLTSSTIDAIRIINSGKNAEDYLLDDISIQQPGSSGSTIKYSLLPETSENIEVARLSVSMGIALDSTLADASMPNLSYNSLLGVTLANGILFREQDVDNVNISVSIRMLGDFLQLPGGTLDSVICDGTNTYVKISIDFLQPFLLNNDTSHEMSFSISDDLSSFDVFRISAECRVRQVLL